MQYANESLFDVSYPRMYSPRMTTIGDRLDKAMKRANIGSQLELAKKSGIPQPTISRILKGQGKKGPETETIKALAKACGVSFEYLNEGRESPTDQAPIQADSATFEEGAFAEELIALIAAYKTTDQKGRELMLSSAKTAAKRTARSRGRVAKNQL